MDEINAHEFEQASEWVELDGINTNVNLDTKIDALAAVEADCALKAAAGAIFPEEECQTSVLPFENIAKTEKYGLKEQEKSCPVKPLPLPPAVNAASSQVAEPEHQFIPECRIPESSDQINTASSDTFVQPLISSNISSKETTMFGSKSKSGGLGGFGGFSKFASDAFKNAKQAGEQLGVKAAQAAQAASTGDLTQIGKTLVSSHLNRVITSSPEDKFTFFYKKISKNGYFW